MSARREKPVPSAVYLVADNLDAVLAAGEDLLALKHDRAAVADVRDAAIADRTFADRVRTLEMTVAARTLQARLRAAEVKAADTRYKSLIMLFISGTATLLDAVADLGNSTTADFHSGGDVVSYLRSRGVIAAETPGLGGIDRLHITETFLVAQRIELGPLMDLCATFLDRLEDHYELYEDAPSDAPPESRAA